MMLGMWVNGIGSLIIAAGVFYYIARDIYVHVFKEFNELKIIYNNDPALENLMQAMHSKMSKLTSAYDQVSEQRPYYEGNNTPDGVTIAIRTESKEFTQDFRTGDRQIEVVVSRSFFQNCPNELLADKFIQQLKMKLMQAPIEKNRSYHDIPVVRIF